jgi:two-component system sensor histidine kinase UhpB
MLGYTETEVLGRDLVEIFPPELRQQIAEHRKLLRSGQSVPSHETVRITKDGRRIDIAISLSAIKDHSGRITGTATMLRDITERKQTEQALHDYARRLQGLSRRMVAVGEIERRKINRELHDLIGQNLAALNINLNIIRSQLSQESLHAVSARLQKTQMLLEETAAHARNVMADLHPPALDDYGLLAALRTYVESFGARVVVPITVHGEDLAPRLSSAAEMALFRVAQGAIANAVQHARAKRIEVLLAATPERVTLTIADDGAGFDPEHVVPARTSWGLTIMQERAEAVGARLTVESTHGEGTRVCVEIDRLTGSKPAMNADEFG